MSTHSSPPKNDKLSDLLSEIDRLLNTPSALQNFADGRWTDFDSARKELQMQKLFWGWRRDSISKKRGRSPNGFAHTVEVRSHTLKIAFGISKLRRAMDAGRMKFQSLEATTRDAESFLELMEDGVINGLEVEIHQFESIGSNWFSDAPPKLVRTLKVGEGVCDRLEAALYWNRREFWRLLGIYEDLEDETIFLGYKFNVDAERLETFLSESIRNWLSGESGELSDPPLARPEWQLKRLREMLREYLTRYGNRFVELRESQPELEEIDLIAGIAYLDSIGEVEVEASRYYAGIRFDRPVAFPIRVVRVPKEAVDVSIEWGKLLIGNVLIPLSGKQGFIVQQLLSKPPRTGLAYDEILEESGEADSLGDGEYDVAQRKRMLKSYYDAINRLNAKILKLTGIRDFFKKDSTSVSFDQDKTS